MYVWVHVVYTAVLCMLKLRTCMRLTIPDTLYTAQKMKFFIKDFFNKSDQIRKKLRIWSHLLKEYLMENFVQL